MSWIDEIEVGDAEGRLAELYKELVQKRGKVSNILKVHSLNPEAMSDHLELYMTLMFGKSGLSRAEREAIGVVSQVRMNPSGGEISAVVPTVSIRWSTIWRSVARARQCPRRCCWISPGR